MFSLMFHHNQHIFFVLFGKVIIKNLLTKSQISLKFKTPHVHSAEPYVGEKRLEQFWKSKLITENFLLPKQTVKG